MTRQSKTPRQKAEEAFGVADRLVKKLDAKKTKLAADLEAVHKEHKAAIERRDYLAQHPDMPRDTEGDGTTTDSAPPTGDDPA